MIAATSFSVEIHQPIAIRPAMTRPFQNAEKLPATKPERMLSDAPPCFEALTTSSTWPEVVEVKTLVNSGMRAPAIVPQLMMTLSAHQRFGSGLPPYEMSPRSTLLATKVTTI